MRKTTLSDLNDIELWDLLMRMSASAKAISKELKRREDKSPWLYPTRQPALHTRPQRVQMTR